MSKKYWAIIILAAVATAASVVYYANQPSWDLGPISFHHKVQLPVTDWQKYNCANEPELSLECYKLARPDLSQSQTQPDTGGTSSPSTVEGWKTYTNSQYGFSFEYPNGWDAIEGSDSVDIGQGSRAYVSVYPIGEKVPTMPGSNSQESKLVVGGFSAVATQWEYANNQSASIISLSPKYPRLWTINNEILFDLTNEQLPLVNQILSTFKFTPTPSGAGQAK